jgi:hypothetical protein
MHQQRIDRGRVLRPLIAAVIGMLVGMLLVGPLPVVLGQITSAATVDANTLQTGRIFSGARSSTPRTMTDASAGSTPVNVSDALSYAGDGRTLNTGSWASTFSSTRYYELTYEAPLAAGRPMSSASFEFDYAANGPGTVCFYFEVRVASTTTVLATYGSSGSPIACNATTTLQPTSTSIPIVTTTDIANDLAIRVYGKHSGAKAMVIDKATVTGSSPDQSFVLYEQSSIDAADGSPATTPWSVATAEATTYTSAANWTTAFNSSRYLIITFGSYVPSGSVISAVSLVHTWKSATTASACYYFEVYNGAVLLGTHGSSGSPVSCNTGTMATDTISLPEATAVADANAVTVKLYAKSAGSRKTNHDLLRLDITYSLQ